MMVGAYYYEHTGYSVQDGEVRVDPVMFFKDRFPDILEEIFKYLRVKPSSPTDLTCVPYLPLKAVSRSWADYITMIESDRNRVVVAENYFRELEEAREKALAPGYDYEKIQTVNMPEPWIRQASYMLSKFCVKCVYVLEYLHAGEKLNSQIKALGDLDQPYHMLKDITLKFLDRGLITSLCGCCKDGFSRKLRDFFIYAFFGTYDESPARLIRAIKLKNLGFGVILPVQQRDRTGVRRYLVGTDLKSGSPKSEYRLRKLGIAYMPIPRFPQLVFDPFPGYLPFF